MSEMNTELIRNDSAMNDSQIQKWREQGPRQGKIMLVSVVAVFAIGVLAIVLLSVGTAFPVPPQAAGQGGWHRGAMRQGPGHELQWLSKKLNLTDGQKAKIKPILADEHKQLASFRKGASLSRPEKRAKFMAIRSKTLDQIRPLLTGAQQTTLRQMQEERQQRMKAWQERRNGSAGSVPQNQ